MAQALMYLDALRLLRRYLHDRRLLARLGRRLVHAGRQALADRACVVMDVIRRLAVHQSLHTRTNGCTRRGYLGLLEDRRVVHVDIDGDLLCGCIRLGGPLQPGSAQTPSITKPHTQRPPCCSRSASVSPWKASCASISGLSMSSAELGDGAAMALRTYLRSLRSDDLVTAVVRSTA